MIDNAGLFLKRISTRKKYFSVIASKCSLAFMPDETKRYFIKHNCKQTVLDGGDRKEMDISGVDSKKNLQQTQAASEEQFSGDTIGSLMAECEELTQQIDSEKERLERFMLETGGASDASDRMEENISSLKDMLSEAENRLQELFDAQEKEAFAPEKKEMDKQKGSKGRVSVKKRLAEKKAETAMRKPHEKEKGRKSPGMNMEK